MDEDNWGEISGLRKVSMAGLLQRGNKLVQSFTSIKSIGFAEYNRAH
jgi:hypothetical protein